MDQPAPPVATLIEGRLEVRAVAWSLVQPRSDRPFLRFSVAGDDTPWALLAPLAAVDALDGPDEWWGMGEPSIGVDEASGVPVVRWVARSTRWERATAVLRADAAGPSFRVEVSGSGTLTDVRLLGGRSTAWPRMGTGRFASGRGFDTLVPGAPDDPRRVTQPAAEPAAVTVYGGSQPGRGRWFFTPGPFAFAASRGGVAPWLGIGLGMRDVSKATFPAVAWEPDDLGFTLRLEYEGHTRVDGRWASPWVTLRPGHPDPYAALAAASGAGETPAAAVPGWWLEPMFCGWGAQVASALGRVAAEPVAGPYESTRRNYDAWLVRLASAGVVPGTVVVDDRWQATYGRNEPDEARWPDLAGWIAGHHAAGRRVLLWWKAWDPEGLPAEWCVRDAGGRPVAADPTNPAYAAALRDDVRRMLGDPAAGGLGADGLKVDFTGATPSGVSLRTWADEHAEAGEPRPWGAALLHRLLSIVADAAREVRPDALLVCHTPNPLFRDVTGMVRLNDALRLDDPDPLVPVVDQLRHRAAIVRAVLPGVPIDTDDWAMPSLEEWRRWQRVKPDIGVPALYHVEGLGTTPERLTDDDLRLVAATWAAYREGLRRTAGPAADGGR